MSDNRTSGVPTISIVVATLDRPRDLRWLVESLRSQVTLPVELIVIDAGTPDSYEANRITLDRLVGVIGRVVHEPAPAGLTRQRNIGVGRTSGEIIVFCDDDVILAPDFLQEVVSGFERFPQALGVTGNALLERAPGRANRRIRRLFGVRDFKDPSPTWMGEVCYVMGTTTDVELHILPGSNMAFRRGVFEVLHLSFDETLEGYALAEDYIFSSQVARYGTLVQLSSARLFHNALQTDRWSEQYARAQIVNLAYFGRLTSVQFGVSRGSIRLRVLIRGARGTALALARRQLRVAARLMRLTAVQACAIDRRMDS